MANSVNTKEVKVKNYSASDIKTLEGLEGVRMRPTVYINSIGMEGVLHLIKEAVDNCIDEFYGGFNTEVVVMVDTKKWVYSIFDKGRGIPVVKEENLSKITGSKVPEKYNFLKDVVTKMHTGGKFSKDVYKISGGLNGIGLKAVNALSDLMTVVVKRDGYTWKQSYSRGESASDLERMDKTNQTGTFVEFTPDETILGTKEIDVEVLRNDLKYRAYLNKGLTITLVVDGKKEVFDFKDGVKEFVRDLNTNPLMKDIIYVDELEVETNTTVELAFTYSKDDEDKTISFCNSINTSEDGTHVTGFRMGLSNTILKYIKDNNLVPKKDKIEVKGDDAREGLVAVVSVKVAEPVYGGQAKQKLISTDVQGIVQKFVNTYFAEWLDVNESKAKMIAKKVIAAAKGREAAKNARKRAQKKETEEFLSYGDIGKLSDCSKDTPDELAEIYIVEGDSAGGSVKDGRDPITQAVFPLKGKILNTHEVDIEKLMISKDGNKEVSDLIKSLKTGYGKMFDVSKLRYQGGVYILTDADSDGKHIESLLLTFFYKHMPDLIRQGYVFIGCPPLYSIEENKKKIFFLDDAEVKKYINGKIVDTYDIALYDGNEVTELTRAKKLKIIPILDAYYNKLKQVSNKYGDIDFIETLMNLIPSYNFLNPDATTPKERDEYREHFESVFEGISVELNDLNQFEFEGIYNDSFNSVIVNDEFINDAYELYNFFEKMGVFTIYVKDSEGEWGETYFSAIDEMTKSVTPKSFKRYKGLGENNSDDLTKTTLDPATRKTIQVKIENFEDAGTITYNLFGPKSDKRKEFLDANQDIDVELEFK